MASYQEILSQWLRDSKHVATGSPSNLNALGSQLDLDSNTVNAIFRALEDPKITAEVMSSH